MNMAVWVHFERFWMILNEKKCDIVVFKAGELLSLSYSRESRAESTGHSFLSTRFSYWSACVSHSRYSSLFGFTQSQGVSEEEERLLWSCWDSRESVGAWILRASWLIKIRHSTTNRGQNCPRFKRPRRLNQAMKYKTTKAKKLLNLILSS